MTLFEIKAAAAAYLEVNTDDLTVNSVDLGLIALNQVRKNAELTHDFEFSRGLVTVNVDSVVGGRLDTAVTYGTTDLVEVKGIVDVGLFSADLGQFYPVEWTTVAEGLARTREENPFSVIRYPTDGQALTGLWGQRRFTFSGMSVYFYPKPLEPISFSLGIEAYLFTPDWTELDLINTDVNVGAPWTTMGQQFMLWGTIIHLNNLFKQFVPRQEGNLAPPTTMMQEGLEMLISWDIFKYEQSRRRGR